VTEINQELLEVGKKHPLWAIWYRLFTKAAFGARWTDSPVSPGTSKATSLCADLKLASPLPSLRPGFQTLIFRLCLMWWQGERREKNLGYETE